MPSPRTEAEGRSDQLVQVVAGLSLLGVLVVLPIRLAQGAPPLWGLLGLALAPGYGAALVLQRKQRRTAARLVLLATSNLGIVFFHLQLGHEARLASASVALLVLSFPLFRGLARGAFLTAAGGQLAVLVLVLATGERIVPSPEIATHVRTFGRVVLALEVPLLVVLLHHLWRSFEHADRSALTNRDRWEQLLSAAPMDVLVVGPDHRLESSNRAGRPDLAPGQPLARALGGYEVSRLFARLSQGDDDGGQGLVLSGCGPSGDRSLRVQAQPLLEGRCLVMLEDVTDRRRQRAQLRAAEEGAAMAEQSRVRLMDRLAHELRTPLTLVLGHTEVLRDRPEDTDPELAAGLDEIHAAARHLRRRIDDLLHAARTPSADLVLQPRDVDLHGFATEVLSLWDGPATVADVRLQLDVGPECSGAYLDPEPARRILWHLMSNAVRFASGGTVILSIRRDGGTLTFAVSDDGLGIPEGLHRRVLEPFVQEGAAAAAGGLGLGLATSRQRARRMGGDLELRPRPGGGTIAALTIPWVDPGREGGATQSLSDPHPARRRALVVDDVLLNAEIAAALLDDQGFDAVVYTEPREGLAAAQEQRFDLALIDCHMPGLSGYELAEALRREPGPNPDLPLVALTIDDSPECAQRCQGAGFSRRLLKPLSAQTLHELLGSLPASNDAPAPPSGRAQDRLLEDLMEEFGPGAFLTDLVRTWRTTTRDHLRELEDGCAGGERAVLLQAAHGMASPARTLGAHQLAALALRLEAAADDDPWPELQALVAQLRTEAESVDERLRRWMDDAA